ncbi:MAG: hypothetical protein NC087_04545 [Anaeroplasma bactoclasticum]|nr:hypothetical protein [Anaeroplasma bactoclasticum]
MQNNFMPAGQQQEVGKANATRNNALVAAEIAKVKAQCVLALNNPRNIQEVESKILGMCSSIYLASEAEYEYPRGGQKITGPSIKLMSAIAQCYKNITSGYTEISRTKERAKIQTFAWDLENNYKYDLEFEIPLYRETKTGRTLLTSDRDIYELIANQAARRIRKCIESVIPRYLIDMAIEKCHETLASKIDVKTELKKLIQWLKSYQGIDLNQIEEKLGMNYEAFSHVQYTTIAKWCTALRDGTISKDELFPPKETKNTDVKEVAQDQLKENGSIHPQNKPATNASPIIEPYEPVEENNMFSETQEDEVDFLQRMVEKYGDN